MKEAHYQAKIIKKLEQDGNYVVKLIATNKNGIPDLLVINKEGVASFIEVKAKNGVLSELQKFRIKELETFGVNVLINRCEI